MRSRSLFLILSGLLLLAACVGSDNEIADPPDTGDFSQAKARNFFDAAYGNIAEYYVDPVDISKLALDGLYGLSTLDPAINFQISTGRFKADNVVSLFDSRHTEIVMNYHQKPVLSLTRPPGNNDYSGWAQLTAKMIAFARSISPNIAANSTEDLYHIIFAGALADLDRFTSYSGVNSANDNRANRDGFGGIGVRLKPDIPSRISEIVVDMPADRAGLQPGDLIRRINETNTDGLSSPELMHLLRGAVDSPVTLAIQRENASPQALTNFTVTLARSYMVNSTVLLRRLDNGIGYVQVTGFNVQTADTLVENIGRLRKEWGGKLRGVIIDLRNNPGGLLNQGVEIADVFLPSGMILTTRGRNPQSQQKFESTGQDILHGLPLIVLINGHSASASEIAAAALQDLGRAVVVGTTSYGKGSVQQVLSLPNSGELALTWARLYAPLGYSLNRFGVVPNVCIGDATNDTDKLLKDLTSGRQNPMKTLAWRQNADNLNAPEQDELAHYCRPVDTDKNVQNDKTDKTTQSESVLKTRSDPDQDLALEIAQILIAQPKYLRLALYGPIANVAEMPHH